MEINIKPVAKLVATKLSKIINKYPVFTRVVAQILAVITTFGWHDSSPFWHVVCIASLAVMSVLNISDAKLRKGTIEKSDEIVEILQDAIVDMVETGAVEIGDLDGLSQETTDENNSTKDEENEKISDSNQNLNEENLGDKL